MKKHISKNIVILTGHEYRHRYFRIRIADDENINVMRSYCEDETLSLNNRSLNNDASQIELEHVRARTQTEKDFFIDYIQSARDKSNPILIQKGGVNSTKVVEEIVSLNPDLILCFGSSLIKSKLLTHFSGRFLNVHLGLSPYYRGSGTNIWPWINNELDMVGATFMYIDEGVDTGEIIHQIRAEVYLGDGPHVVGNRLIRDMTNVFANIVKRFDELVPQRQPVLSGYSERVYKMNDFNEEACQMIYKNIAHGVVHSHVMTDTGTELKYIVKNPALIIE